MFTLYTKKSFVENGELQHCKYCELAKELLTENNLPFIEVQFDKAPQIFYDYDHKTYPMIFRDVDGSLEYIGGYDSLVEYLDWELS